ncbi:MAG: hypothetical protein AB7D28_00415 [Candidatus Berkiella sp.]
MRCLKSTLFLISSTLLSATQAYAEWDWNLLLGASAGIASREGKLTTEMDYTNNIIPPGFFLTNVKNNLKDTGFIWGIIGGAQASCGAYMFGVEANVDWPHYDSAHAFAFTDSKGVQGWNGLARYEQGNNIALSIRAGYRVFDWLMGYIRVGGETSKDTLRAQFSGNEFYPFGISMEDSRRSLRFLGGAGIEIPFPFISGLVARAEYNFHSKGKNLGVHGAITDNFNIDPSFVAETRQKMHSGIGAIVWNFG